MTNETYHRLRNPQRAGYALLAAIFSIIVVSLLALTGLYVARNDADANTGLHRGWKAFYAADAGTGEVLATWNDSIARALSPGDSFATGWRTLDNGAVYRTSVLRVDDGTSTTLLRLRTVGRADPGLTAQRTIVAMATVGPYVGDVASIQGGGNNDQAHLKLGLGPTLVSGRDTIPAGWEGACPGSLRNKPGLSWKDENKINIGPGSTVEGDPPVEIDPSIDNNFEWGGYSFDELAAMADHTIGTTALSVQPTLTEGGDCDTSDWSNWGAPEDPSSPCFSHMPIIYAPANLDILNGPSVGQGILLVEKGLKIEGDFTFYGLIMVKEKTDLLEDNVTIYGGIMVGQELQMLGSTVRYSQCALGRTLEELGIAGRIQRLAGRYWFQIL